MRNRIILLLIVLCSGICAATAKSNFYESNIFDGVAKGDKVAILMVHFGTSHDDTRAKTIDVINEKVKAKYPEFEHREAWTSRMVIRILGQRGETIDNPKEALLKLKADGYTHVIVQSSNVIYGIEMESLMRDVLDVKGLFKDVRVGTPLLYTTRDYEVVVDAFRAKQPSKSALVLVGHGTYTTATAQYAMVDYIIRGKGYKAMHVGTVEGYPDYEAMLARLKADKVKSVLLMPFMFVAGVHAKTDIAEEWYRCLTDEGYNVSFKLEGMGEMIETQELLLEHIEFAIHNQMDDIMEKKAFYAVGDSCESN